MKRLVHIRLGHRNVILESSGKRLPHCMDRAQYRIAILDGIYYYPDSGKVVYLLKRFAFLHFAPDAVKMLGSAVYISFYAQFVEHLFKIHGNRFNQFLSFDLGRSDLFGDHIVVFGMQISETEVFEFAFYAGDTQTRRYRSVYLQRFGRDPLTVFLLTVRKRTHIMQSVRQFYNYNADIVAHREEHPSQVFSLRFLARFEVELVQLSHAVNKHDYAVTEFVFYLFFRYPRIFYDVVQKRRDYRIAVKPQIYQYGSNCYGMDEILLARMSELTFMRSFRKVIRADYPLIARIRISILYLSQKIFDHITLPAAISDNSILI